MFSEEDELLRLGIVLVTGGDGGKQLIQPPVATSNSSTYGRVKLLHPGRGGTVEL